MTGSCSDGSRPRREDGGQRPGRATAVCAIALLLGAGIARAGAPPDTAALAAAGEARFADAVALLREALAIPNDALFAEQVEDNVRWSEAQFQARGFTTRRLETGGPPLLLAERQDGGGDPTVLIYLQLDGQPVDPSRWEPPTPYQAVLKAPTGDGWTPIPWDRLADGYDPDWRVFGRSAADAKGPVVMMLAALDAMAAGGMRIPYRLKVVMDFEEELGSPHLPGAVERHREALAADALAIFDGPMHASNRPTLVYGARGIATVTLTVFGPRLPQHSGHFGNFVPNPAQRLAELLADMKGDDGRVTLPGFYAGVEIDEATRKELARTPVDEAALKARLGIAQAEGVAPSYQESLQYPSLNIRGLRSAWVGAQSRTIIPATATAELDLRLVPETDAHRLVGLVRDHVRSAGYHLIAGAAPTDEERTRYPRLAAFDYEISYGAFRTPFDAPAGRWLERALTRAEAASPVQIRTMGGSIPIAPFVLELGVPAIAVPTANPDNNQHSPNENLRLGNLAAGIRIYLAILTEPFTAARPRPRNTSGEDST
jgi:acetylornithine deacetylase/succinyl-diaminopimelate desuccinylase-like protein